MSLYIIDASVAARFLLFEDLSDKAEYVLEDFMNGKIELIAPELLIYEVGNILWRAFKQGFISLQDARERISYFLKLQLNVIKLGREDYEEVLDLSIKNDVTYYDATYLAAAKKVKGTLLLADNMLYERANKVVPTLHLKYYRKT
ncbi:MAG: type II toxin-antitoxin system VapC family toxin [Nitrososphaeria archaeon]